MLAIDHVTRVFPGGQTALSDIDLALGEGEIVAMVGGSGCGKTTLLRLISGLDRPSQGAIRVNGAEITAPSADVGIIFQEPRLLPWLSVLDNIAFPLAHLPRAEARERAERVLLRVGLGGYGARWPRDLSGGQMQRVSIARALVTEPKLLLLDEPFSALDAFTRASLHDHLLALWEERRPTLLIVTHDVEEAITLANRVVVMQPNPGRIFAELPVDLPRPRDRLADEFNGLKRNVLAALDGSLSASQQGTMQKAATPTAFWW